MDFGRRIEPPVPLATERYRLEPLGPEHNDRDHAAWTNSIDHVAATPGFRSEDWAGDVWPRPMSLAENLADLEQHAHEFADGSAFAYSVVSPAPPFDVIGCVYIDPDETRTVGADPVGSVAMVRCWLIAARADLEAVLVAEVDRWLAEAWPFTSVRWPGRCLGVTEA